MSRFDDETLMRRLDGEIPESEAGAIDAAAAGDAALAARLARFRRVREAARDAFPIASDARDADLSRLIAGATPSRTASPADMITRWAATLLRGPAAPAVWAGASAAAFCAGLLLSPALSGGREGLTVGDGGRIADAGLERVLDARLAAEGVGDDGYAVGLTFRDVDGRWCRTFVNARKGIGGAACAADEGWRLEAMAPLSGQGGELRQASSDTPAPVLAAVDALIAGESLDATAETRARDAGWR